jgi:mRNA-degrading endonuclease HigB of HigAB toxin-antitoxin module
VARGKARDTAGCAETAADVHHEERLRGQRKIDGVARTSAVFNIEGNKYRIVVWINYPYRVVYIRFVGTHTQYDAIDAQRI